jgi:hypothetical protein
MSDPGQSPAAVATQLLVDFCLPVAKGEERGGRANAFAMEEEQRRAIGMVTPGDTYAFPAAGASVFLDINPQRLQIWFVHPDARICADSVEKALLTRFPAMRRITDKPAPPVGRAERYFGADFGDSKGVQVDMTYPDGTKGGNIFVLRIISMAIIDRAAFARSLS